MGDELRDQIKAALGDVRSLITVGTDGQIHYRLTAATDAVHALVGPLMAEKDAEIARVRQNFRTADRAATVLDAEWEAADDECTLLRWLHAEAAFERDRERASRQAWSAEALKWEYYSQLPRSAIDLVVFNDALGRPVCACISDDQASQLGPGFSRPVCAVHLDTPPNSAPTEDDGAISEDDPTWLAVGGDPLSASPWAEGGEPG